MNNTDKEQKIWIMVTIATVTILIFIFAGITYAFFTSNDNTGSTAEITNTSGKMTITYTDGGNNLLVSSNISPSNNIIANKTFTLTGVNTSTADGGLSMPYKVGIKYTSSFSDGQIHYYIKEVNRANTSNVTVNYTGETNQTVQGNPTYTGYTHGTLKNGNRYTELVTGEFPASTNNQTITFNLLMQFPDTGENQDTEKSKSINAYIEINHELNASEYIATLDKETNGLEIDDTDDQNLRYVGSTPNNYISFNNETWRIIGVFDVINADTNMKESLVKIIRNNSLGYYAWDTSDSAINSGYGINEWSQAKLMNELNTDYLDISKISGTTTWYNGENNLKNAVYSYDKNIKKEYIDKIANVRWNLGGSSSNFNSAKSFYTLERGTSHIINSSDGVTRTNTWDGKVALIYISDYGYASTDNECRKNLVSNSNSVFNCKKNNWLFFNSNSWTLSVSSSSLDGVYVTRSGGYVDIYNSKFLNEVRPSLYLRTDILILSGTGTESDPYIID